MNLPNGFQRITPYDELAGYERVPDTFIIDMEPELRVFWDTAADAPERFNYPIDEIVTEILMHISDQVFLESGIKALRDDVLFYHARDDRSGEGELLVQAATTLATTMAERFEELGAYLPDGIFPFELRGWIGDTTAVYGKCREVPF